MTESFALPTTSRPAPRNGRRGSFKTRRLAMLSLAAALTLPTIGASRLLAADPSRPVMAVASSALDADNDAPPSMSNADRFALGQDQLKKNQYEEALATLQQVSPEMLAPADQQKLTDSIAKATDGANQRKAARAEFEKGEQSLANNQPADALMHYQAAADSRFADEGTRAKAREQMELAKSGIRKAGDSMKDTYASAKDDLKAGRLTDAKAKFEQLKASGYRAGLFQKSPGDYLDEVNAKLAKMPQPPPPPVAANNVSNNATNEPPVSASSSPAGTSDTSMAQPTTAPADTTAMTTPAPAATEEATAMAKPASASEAYHIARDQYRKGDWNAARQNFQLAQAMGYKTGLFEDAPAKYLARMDAKEQADAEKNRAQLAMGQSGNMGGSTQSAPGDAAAKADANKYEARGLVEQAENARANNDIQKALDLYTRAAELDPSNLAAVNGKSEMLTQSGRAPAQDPLAKLESDNKATRQYIDYQFTTDIDESNKALARNEFDTATQYLNKAKVARASNETVFTPEELRRYDATLSSQEQSIATKRNAYQQAEVQSNYQQVSGQIATQATEDLKRKRETVRQLIITARTYTDQGKYTEALGVVDQILTIDPQNDYAVGVRPLIEDRAVIAEQRKYKESFDRNFEKVLNEAEEKRIPYSDILRYPENWPDLSAEREKSVAAERGEQTQDAAVAAQLDRILPELNFPSTPFTDVIDFLRDITQANIFVNWKALEAAGVDRNAPVTARLRNVKFSKALRTILDEVSGGTVKLAFTIDDGVISISTEDDLAKNVVTRVYDIRDLIIDVPDFTDAPNFNLSSSSGGRGRGGNGGGGGGNGGDSNNNGIFGNDNNNSNNENNANTPTRSELVDAIIKLIEDTVSSDSWKDNGGTVGSIRELGGQLIVTQTPENQRNLVALLEQLRETRAIQVTIETRFLFVQRNFLEDIGVDVDAVFGINGPGSIAGNIPGPISVQQTSSDFTQASRLDTTLPGNLGGTNFVGSAISTGVTFLDDFSVSVLLRATQAQVNSTQLTAPRITLFNGQRAYVVVSVERAYVSDLNPVVGNGAVAFDPVIDVVQTGVELDVQATVSSDRKYVTLTLRPTLSRLLDLVTFPVGGATSFGGDSTTQPLFNSGNVQEPELQITRVRTTVSVPDGGTLLLGGQTLSAEIEREEGVPILSKIPFLKRLFTNRGYVKDDQVLLILVKPTIIIQREREAEQFPLLSQKAGG